MTIVAAATKYRYLGNGATATFSYPNRVYAQTDLKVDLLVRSTSKLIETLTLTTDYTVAIAANGQATVTITNAAKIPSTTQDCLVRLDLPLTQTVELPTGTPFPAKKVEDLGDKLTSIAQALAEVDSRSLKYAVQSPATDVTIPNPVADATILFDGTTGKFKVGPTLNDLANAETNAETAAAEAVIAIAAADRAEAAVAPIEGNLVAYTPVETNLKAWWDFNDYNGFTVVSGALSNVPDKSYYANSATQASAGIRPLWSRTALSGRGAGAVLSSAANYSMNCGSNTDIDNLFVGGGTVYGTFCLTGSGANQSLFGKSADGFVTSGYSLLFFGSGNPTMRWFYALSTQAGNWDVNAPIELNKTYMFELYYNSSTPTTAPVIKLNGVTQTLTVSATPIGTHASDAAGNFILGNLTDGGTQPLRGNIGQLALYKGAASADYRVRLCSYLAMLSGMEVAPVYILAGQSNMVGNALNDGNNYYEPATGYTKKPQIWSGTDYADLLIGSTNQGLDATMFGPEMSFGGYQSALMQQRAYLVKYAVGATSLAVNWNPSGGAQWTALQARVNAAILSLSAAGKFPVVAAFLWTQGETDAQNLTNANAYQTNLTAFASAVTSTILAPYPVAPDYLFLISGLPTQNIVTIPYQATVRAAQVAVGALAGRAYISTTDLTLNGDGVHLNPAGANTLGNRFAAATSKSFVQFLDSFNSARNTADAIVNSKLALAPAGTIKANPLTSSASPTDVLAGAGLVLDSSSLRLKAKCAISVSLGTNQTIAATTATKVQLNTEQFDTDNCFDNATNYRFTPTVAGYYEVSAQGYLAGANNRSEIRLVRNGTTVATGGEGGVADQVFGVSKLLYMNGSSDYIELFVYSFSSISTTLQSGVNATYMTAFFVGV